VAQIKERHLSITSAKAGRVFSASQDFFLGRVQQNSKREKIGGKSARELTIHFIVKYAVWRAHKWGVRGVPASLLDHLVSPVCGFAFRQLRFSPAGASFLIVNNAIISFSFKANRRQQQQRGKKSNSYRITGHKKEIKQKKEKEGGCCWASWRVAATCCPGFFPRFLFRGWRKNLMHAQNLNYVVLSHVSLFFFWLRFVVVSLFF